ncbi:MAG: DUF6785 family protein [Planctomycetota bacterium]
MTKRAVGIGLALAVTLCGVTYFNNSVMRQTWLVGNYLPISVYGSLVLFLVIVNPLLGRIGGSWRLGSRELAVILALVLAACGIAESGLLRGFTNALMMPHQHRKTNPGWDEAKVFDRLSPAMLAARGEDDEALNGFVQGAVDTGPASPADVPWSEWAGALAVWVPVVVLLIVAFVGLALVVHRQWIKHEHLPYPLATFASSLMGEGGEGAKGAPGDEAARPVLSQRAFWIAAGIVLAIHMLNFAHSWWPERMVEFPTRFNFSSIFRLIPAFEKGRLAGGLYHLRIYFSVIGFAFLVASDVSLSFGLGPFVYTIIEGILAGYGVPVNEGGEHRASLSTSLNMGSYFAYAVMIIYCGRFYYLNVLRRAVGVRPLEEPASEAVWGMRVFLGCSLLLAALLVAYGLAWPFALLYVLGIAVIYLSVSRVVAETGLFFLKPLWAPHVLLMGLFGMRALGASAGLIAALFSAVLFAEPREMVMPFVVNSFGLLDRQRVGPARMAAWCAGAAALGLIVGIAVTLTFQYNRGTDKTDYWTTQAVPKYPFRIAVDAEQKLAGQGVLEESDSMSSLGRVFAIRPGAGFAVSFIIGAALVVGAYVGRLRVKGWPIHPAVFLIWWWGPGARFAFSFLLGWFIKHMVLKYGGWSVCQRLKPVMFGLIAGEMLGGVIPAIISVLYYLVSGELPAPYSFMPSW